MVGSPRPAPLPHARAVPHGLAITGAPAHRLGVANVSGREVGVFPQCSVPVLQPRLHPSAPQRAAPAAGQVHGLGPPSGESSYQPFEPSVRPYLSGRRRRAQRRASVRRSNCTCGSPACRFHEVAACGHGFKEGISAIRLTSPNSPRRRRVGKVRHPAQRHRVWWCDHSRRTTHRSSWLKSLRT
jgi:hypothetical protein